MKKRFLRLFFTLFALSLLSDFFVSCTQDQTFPDYLKDYTEEAGIGYFKIEGDTVTDKYGNICVDSKEDLQIHLFLHNPRGFNLIWNYFSASGLNPYFASLNDGNTEFAMIIKADVLKAYDSGLKTAVIDEDSFVTREIGGKISLSTDVNGTIREFKNPYTLKKVVVNSAPGKIKGAKFQSTSDKKYVLCFNVPVIQGTVHNYDTHTVYIGNHKWTFNGNFENLISSSSGDGVLSTSAPAGMTALDGSVSDFEKEGTGYFQAYYVTNIPVADDDREIKYLIKLEDDDGLKSELNISNKAKRLSLPLFNLTEKGNGFYNDEMSDSETGYWNFEISHSGKTEIENGTSVNCGMPVINYVIKNNGNIVKQGKGIAPVKIPLPANQNYTCEAYASKDYYIDSDSSVSNSFNIIRSNKYYVRNNGNDEWPGSRKEPYKTLTKVIENINSRPDSCSDFEIYLLSDIAFTQNELPTDENCFCIFPSNCTYTIKGIGEQRSIDAGTYGGIFNFYNSEIEISNLKFKNAKNERALSIVGDMKLETTINDCDFEANSDYENGMAIYIENSKLQLFLNNCNFDSNEGLNGGAIYLPCSAEINKCTFNENYSRMGSDGGAVFIDNNNAEVVFTDCDFVLNMSDNVGGAVSISADTMTTFNNCTFEENSASDKGGAIFINKTSSNSGKITLNSCEFYKNYSFGTGGAVYVSHMSNELKIKGKITAISNIKVIGNLQNTKPDNFYLASGAKINILDSISGSKIGITTQEIPIVGKQIEFTSGYKTKNESIYPSFIFTSDADYGIAWNEDVTEAVLAVSGGGITEGTKDWIGFELEEDWFMTQGTEKVFTLRYIGNQSYTIDDFTFEYKLKIMFEEVPSNKYKTHENDASLGHNQILLKDTLPVGNYTLSVIATMGGKSYPAEFDIYVRNN